MDKQDIPPFAALKAFEAVFRLGGVRKAAQSLGVSHAVVSRHVGSLEDWLGVALVSRAANRLSLTETGLRYHAKISAAFAEMACATRELREEDRNQTLRLQCIPGLSIQWLTHQFVDFARQHPDIKVDVRPSDTPADLISREADVNILFHRDRDGNHMPGKWLMAQCLGRPEQVVVASPSLAAQLPRITGPAGLLDWPLLHGGQRDDWRTWLALNGVHIDHQLPGTLCWHVHMAIAAAKMGQGVLLTNRFLVQEELARGDLAKLDVVAASSVSIGAYLFVAREDRWSSPGIAALRRFLRERMRNQEARAVVPPVSAE